MWVHHRFLRWSPCFSSFYFAVLCYFVLFVIVLCLVCPVLFIIVLCIVCRVLFVIVLCLVCPVLFVIALCLVCPVLFVIVCVLCVLCCLSSLCVLCAVCCQCIWIVHSWLSDRFSYTLIYYAYILYSMKEWRSPVSYVTSVTCASELSIFDCFLIRLFIIYVF